MVLGGLALAFSRLIDNSVVVLENIFRHMTAAADLNAKAQEQNALATREQIIFAVDQAFYDGLSSDVLVKVADQTVQARQVLVNQIEALEKAKLRSALDLSFANVSLAQAELLRVNAKNNRDAAYATLSEALGLPTSNLSSWSM